MDFIDMSESKKELSDVNFLEYKGSTQILEEKCGLIYRINEHFTYECLICKLTFIDISLFQNHILKNHDTSQNFKVENNESQNDEFELDQNDDEIYKELENNFEFNNESKKQLNYPVDQIVVNENINNSRRSSRKRKLSLTESNIKYNSVSRLKSKFCSKRRSVNRIKWQLDKIFSNECDAQNYIFSEKIWSFLHKNFTKKGMKKYYRCNRVKFRGEQCASSILYFLNNETGKCEIFRSNAEHTCDSIGSLQSKSRITTEIKKQIEDLYEKGIKLKDVVNKAEKEYNLKSGQIRHFLKILKVRKEKSLKSEVEEWIKVSQNVPKNLYEPFVVNFESEESFLRFFISSQNLLSNAVSSKVINISGVKKLNWHRYTIFFPGTIVDTNQFKCFGIAICQNDGIDDFTFIFKSIFAAMEKYFNVSFAPKVLFRDSNINIEIAFQKMFDSEDIKTKICWNHVRNRFRSKLEYLLPEHHNKKEEILKELDEIQKSDSFEEFRERVDDFSNKWALYVEFVTYFHQEWIDKNFNWYEGIDQETISNNNPIDQLVKRIQNDENFRERLPFNLFKNKFFEWINELSILTERKCTKENDNNGTKEEAIETQFAPIESPTQKKSGDFLENSSSFLNSTSSFPDNLRKLTTSKKQGPKISYKTTTCAKKSSTLKVPQSERKKRSKKLWKEDRIFKSLVEAELAVESEKIWSLSTKNRTKGGAKIYFRCNKVPFRGTQCDASIYLFLKSDCTEVILVRSGLPHNCHEIAFKSRGIDKEIRTEVERLNELSWKPSQILDYIQGQNYKCPPTKTQISNYMAVLREKKFAAINLDQEIFKSWLKNYSQVPDNDTKMFIVAYEGVNEQHQFFFSSKKLLQNAINIKFIHCDGIHKLEWIKFPIYFVGTTDDQANFHSLGVVICYGNEQQNFEFIFKSLKDGIFRIFNYIINPKVLITDTNSTIQLAFKNIFGEEKIKICWDIVRKTIKRKLDELSITKENNAGIQKDLENLHCSTSEMEFKERTNLFMTKWSDHKEFITYFHKEWVQSNKNWYQGYDITSPMTNTKLEIFVKSFKSDQLFRKKISIESFSKILNKCIKHWSLDSNNISI